MTQTVDRTQYREVYLRSPHWARVRAAALERAGHRCQVCNAPRNLDVHHRTYERLGAELPMDLTVLCRQCHDLFHDSAKVHKAKTQPVGDQPSRKHRQRGRRACQCGCGMPVKRKYVPGHYQRKMKAEARAREKAKKAKAKRQEVWDAVTNPRGAHVRICDLRDLDE